MRVLHVIPSVSERSGGPAIAILPMCRALQKRGVEVVIATTTEGQTPINTDGVPIKRFPVQLGASFKYSRPLATWLKTNVREFDLVHIHAVFNHACVAAARESRKCGVPYVVRPLGTLDPWSMKQKPLRKRLFWTLSGKAMLAGSAAVHYTAAAEKEATENYLGLNHGRVIALGVEVNGSKQTATECYPELRDHPYVLVLSRLHPKKGLELLIDAFRSLKTDAWKLVVAGDGPLDYVTRLKGRAGESDGILFTGWVEGEQKEALLRGASLLALPSRQENFALCVLEAMARGVPVLVSPHVNLAREIEAADAGWVVELDALSHGLSMALTDDSERIRRGKAATQFAQRYSWEKTAIDLTDLYECLIKSRH